MNNKTFWVIIILCLGLQMPNFGGEKRNFDSEKKHFSSGKRQSWWDWLRSKWEGSSVVSVATAKVKAKALAKTIKLAVRFSGLKSNTVMDIVDLFLAFLEDMEPILSSYRMGSIDKDEAMEKIKEDLFVMINNQLLYPTRSSKINALLKKDEFLQYVNDQEDLLQDACNQLIEEISALDYSATKKAADDAIDARMATIRSAIIRGQSLTEQINELETKIGQKQHFDIPEMQAYLSLYFRLKNKQRVEGKLTKEEKEFQQPWKIEKSKIEKHIISEPSVD